MKKEIILSIEKPCHENWNNFTPTDRGRFCGSCSKVVIDFTAASDEEVFEFINHKPVHACGRFRANQFKTYSAPVRPAVRPGFTVLKAGAISLLLMLVQKTGVAQSTPVPALSAWSPDANSKIDPEQTDRDHIVRGIVHDEEGNALPGVSVVLKNSNVGVATDHGGKFEFPQKLKRGDTLVFYFIGFQHREVVIDNEMPVDIKLTLEAFHTMGEMMISDPYTPKPSFLKRSWYAIKNIF